MAGAPGFAHVRWDAETEVEVTTLDAVIAREGRPRFIKIDVEGAEYTVLTGLGLLAALPAAGRTIKVAQRRDLRLGVAGEHGLAQLIREGADPADLASQSAARDQLSGIGEYRLELAERAALTAPVDSFHGTTP